MNYDCDERFNGYYLEDSYVLGIAESDDELCFSIECVLTPTHPAYAAPPPTEQHCYRRASLIFKAVTERNWRRRSPAVFTDITGEEDYGNIDAFEIDPSGQYRLEGDWGEVELVAASAKIVLM